MGMIDLPFAIDNVCCETHSLSKGRAFGWLRSVAIFIMRPYAVGCTLDEVAEARGVDPIQNTLEFLGGDRIIDFASITPEFSELR